MLKGKKVAIIFTASILGGHELMTLAHINRYIKRGVSITCYIPLKNYRLAELLSYSSIKYEFHDVRHNNMEIIHAFLNIRHFLNAANFIMKINKNFDFIFIIQGDIEFGSVFINVGRVLRMNNIISYLPYTHSFKKMNSRVPGVKDFFAKFVYRNCNCFFTICDTTADEIISKNKKATVRVLENFVARPVVKEIRGVGYVFTPTNNKLRIIMAGRVLFRQKGQDILINALRNINFSVELRVFGDGPDLERLREMANSLGENIDVTFFGWKNDVWEFSQDVDFVVVPSRYEGVPLIMLESLARNVPVISPARDGMVYYLASDSLYDIGSAEFESNELRRKIKDLFIKNNLVGMAHE
ncbi:glycosyltransferase [Serratia proteamaculans]|uniref:glycosyltransferase n=1 Tax=Serratia proteamaculans TaxID=28151 RepID=UPI002178079B|nr:glycosyltransferase [Serratia proteamaculans]CAI1666078.1 Lipopolysaccharide core biosynthesis protein rfaG [Serratia proteamaculans]